MALTKEQKQERFDVEFWELDVDKQIEILNKFIELTPEQEQRKYYEQTEKNINRDFGSAFDLIANLLSYEADDAFYILFEDGTARTCSQDEVDEAIELYIDAIWNKEECWKDILDLDE